MLNPLKHRPRSRVDLLAGCALGAMLVTMPRVAAAQAFNGTPTIQAGDVAFSRDSVSTPGSETITIRSNSAVIQWQNFSSGGGGGGGGSIDFLPSGSSAFFNSGNGTGTFTVLNRIITPASNLPVAINGAVYGINLVGQTVTPTGNILFYNPNGLIVGPNAIISAASLVLTTNDIAFDPTSGSVFDTNGVMHFSGAAGSRAEVNVMPTAQVTATGTNSYVAIVAPRVRIGGTVTANRSISYVAGEQVDATVNAGLFDFTILTGTTDPNGIIHTGNTTGAASVNGTDTKWISMVALPKNTALTMLLSGSAGYAPASNVNSDGSTIVLSAGYANRLPVSSPNNQLGSIAIGNTTFRNRLTGFATNSVAIEPTGNGVAFDGAFNQIYALNSITMDVGPEEFVSAGQYLSLGAGTPTTGGLIDIDIQGGQLDVSNGYLSLSSSNGSGTYNYYDYSDPNATGGEVNISVNGGSIDASSGLYISAEGYGTSFSGTGGNGTGGNVSVFVDNDGRITGSQFYITADGYGGDAYSNFGSGGGGGSVTGGTGTGGTIDVQVLEGQLQFNNLDFYARAYGGDGEDIGGEAIGGGISLAVGSNQHWSSLYLDASVEGGEGYFGRPGNAVGRPYGIDFTISPIFGRDLATPVVTIDNYIELTARATIQSANGLGAGAVGNGGGASINVRDGATLITSTINLNVDANVYQDYYYGYGSGEDLIGGPDLFGGIASLNVIGGNVMAGDVLISAAAYGMGATDSNGLATGGSAEVSVYNGGQLIIDGGEGFYYTTPGLRLLADAYGGMGPVPANSRGGNASLYVGDGYVSVDGPIRVSASGLSQELPYYEGETIDANGPDTEGGYASISVSGGELYSGPVTVAADGDSRPFVIFDGGEGSTETYYVPLNGNGGTGTGGWAGFNISGGTAEFDTLLVSSSGYGGASRASPSDGTVNFSGNGAGGQSMLSQAGGTISTGSIQIISDGFGGSDDNSAQAGEILAVAGDGQGGRAFFEQVGGAVSTNGLLLSAQGFGGNGMFNADNTPMTFGGAGGNGTGGVATLTTPLDYYFGDTATLQVYDSLEVLALGYGGAGGLSAVGPRNAGNGGTARGGFASVDLSNSAFQLNSVLIDGSGQGGTGPEVEVTYPGVDPETNEPRDYTYTYYTVGYSIAGNAAFSLIDGGEGGGIPPSLPAFRQIADLNLFANGDGAEGSIPQLAFTVQTGAQDYMPIISGNVYGSSYAYNSLDPEVPGFEGLIEGGTLSVGGGFDIGTSGNINFTIADDSLLDVGSFLQLSSGTRVTTDGLIRSGGVSYIYGYSGIDMSNLESGAETYLQANLGPTIVGNLQSVGPVHAFGTSIDIESPGALHFAIASASGGSLSIATTGDLSFEEATATTTASLSSSDGTVVGSGPLIAGGNLSVEGYVGVELLETVSGGTTLLSSEDGPVSVTALTSAGIVTAYGSSIDITSPGALTFDSADAFDGALSITAQGNLTIQSGSTTTNLTLASLGGTLSSASLLSAPGNVSLTSFNGLTASEVTSGGTTFLSTANGPLVVEALTSPGAVTASGASITIGSPDALTFALLNATTGPLSVTTAGDLIVPTVSGSQAVSLVSTGGAFYGNGTVTSAGPLTVAGQAGLYASALNSGSTTSLSSSDGPIFISSLTSTGAVSAEGGSVSLYSPGTLSFSSLVAISGSLNVQTAGSLNMGTVVAPGNVYFISENGSFTSTGSITSGNNLEIYALTGIQLASANSSGRTILSSENGAVNVNSLISGGEVGVEGTAVNIFSPGRLVLASPRATNGNLVVTTQGDLIINDNQIIDGGEGGTVPGGTLGLDPLLPTAQASATQAVLLTSLGGLIDITGNVTGGRITLDAARGIRANGSLLATGELTVEAGDRFTLLSGVGSGTTVSVLSGDISLENGARLGQRGLTRELYVHNGAGGTTFVGLDGGEGSYTLDASEASRLFADQLISIGFTSHGNTSGQGSGGGGLAVGDTIVGNLAMSFGAEGNIGAGGTLEISAPETIEINGNVAISTASAGDTVLFDPTLIALNTDTGSISLIGQTGAPLGNLALAGGTIVVGNADLIAQVRDGATHAELLDALNSGPVLDTPPLRAGALFFDVADALYIQNTGISPATADRQGFLASSLSINTGSSETVIDINGRIVTNLATITGGDVIPLVTINDVAAASGGLFDPLSRINGCVIGQTCGRIDGKPPTDDDLTYPIDPGGPLGGQLVAPLVTIVPNEPLITPPLVDEPITGVGNDDLWQSLCEPDETSCPEGETAQ